jgi:hypothetical protein
LLDDISTYLTMACHPEDGIDLLAQYTDGNPSAPASGLELAQSAD